MFYKTILFVHDALGALFIPKWESLADFGLWTNAMGQAFFSISVVAGVMIAYGSYLKSDSNIVSDSLISEIVAGWLVVLFSLISRLIINIIMKFTKKSKQIAELEKGDPIDDGGGTGI